MARWKQQPSIKLIFYLMNFIDGKWIGFVSLTMAWPEIECNFNSNILYVYFGNVYFGSSRRKKKSWIHRVCMVCVWYAHVMSHMRKNGFQTDLDLIWLQLANMNELEFVCKWNSGEKKLITAFSSSKWPEMSEIAIWLANRKLTFQPGLCRLIESTSTSVVLFHN